MGRSARLVVILGVLVIIALVAIWVTPGQATGSQRYIVLFKQQSVPADGAQVVRKANGTVLASYDAIGVMVVRSSSGDFPSDVLADQRVEGVAATYSLRRPLNSNENVVALDREASQDADPLAPLTPLTYTSDTSNEFGSTGTVAILGGSVDLTDNLVAPWIDQKESVSCASGAPSGSAENWSSPNGKGTAGAEYLAARLAAAQLPVSEPKPAIAVVRVTDDQGQVSPEALICGLNWAATHHAISAVIGDSSSPLLLQCQDVTDERIAWFAEQRSLTFAALQHVQLLQVRGAGTSHSASPSASPDNQCAVLPGSANNAAPIVTTTP